MKTQRHHVSLGLRPEPFAKRFYALARHACLSSDEKCWGRQSPSLTPFLLFPSFPKEKERELCVRERLAEDKLARAEGLLKNYSLLKEQRLLSLASSPGTRISSAGRGRGGHQCCLGGFGSPYKSEPLRWR